MRKFCCELWNSAVETIQTQAKDEINEDSLIADAEYRAIGLWANHCPACGLSLTVDESINLKPFDRPLTSVYCASCSGTGHAGGSKDATVKCIVCLGTGKITPTKNYGDKLAKLEELKTKIRREGKPIDPESLNPKLIK